VKSRQYDTIGTSLGLEISNSDDSVNMHTDQNGSHVAGIKIDRESLTSGNICMGQTQLALCDPVDDTAGDVDPGALTLPDGGLD
jgi:hypothetical protein